MSDEAVVLACQFQEWFPIFTPHTFQSRIIQLPEEFVSYLLDDGVHLCESSQAAPIKPANGEWESYRDDYEPLEESSSDSEVEVPQFVELEKSVNKLINDLGGTVLPKLNWSCPKDAGWLSPNGSLECKNAAEVFLLLKSSDSIVHDLCHAFDSCTETTLERPAQFFLVLRKYYKLNFEMEFRCFIKLRTIVGICQRNVTEHYPQLLDNKDEVIDLICSFFFTNIRDTFKLPNYTLDVYISSKKRVKIVDFNVWRGSTLPLLFSWEELESAAAKNLKEVALEFSNLALDSQDKRPISEAPLPDIEPEFRVVESPLSVRPALRAMAGVPLDLYDVTPGSAIDEFLKKAAEDPS